MKRKTINAVISKKINQWLDSIEDKKLAKEMRNKIIVTGGCITSMLLNEPVNDFDIYLTDKDIVKKVANYYCDVFNKNTNRNNNGVSQISPDNNPNVAWVLDGKDVQDWKKGKKSLSSFAVGYKDIEYNPQMEWDSLIKIPSGPSGMLLATSEDRVKVMINSVGIAQDDSTADDVEYNVDDYIKAVSDGDEVPAEDLENTNSKKRYRPIFLSENAITLSDKIQIVIRFYGDAKEIHSNYDFVHTTNYWTFNDGVVLNERALEAILNKELFYTGSKYPIASVIRTRKFIKRGWHINAGQYLKMCLQISKLDLNNIYVLQDQLTGVDSIYFMNFIARVREQIESGKKIDLTGDYVVSVIDKIF